jgi:hypothetical protein
MTRRRQDREAPRLSRQLLALMALLLPLALLVPAAVPAGAAPAPDPAQQISVLVGVRAAHHPGFDRIVFDFEGPVPDHRTVEWSEGPRHGGSGALMSLHGNAFLEVNMFAHTPDELGRGGPIHPGDHLSLGLPNLNDVSGVWSFEGVTSVGIGVMHRTEILRAFTLENPSRYVIDVSTDFPQRWARVYFVDENRAAVGTEPVVRHVLRRVPVPAVATGQLHRLFAGPTPAERESGLVLVDSLVPVSRGTDHKSEFTDLRVSDGVAHVRLTRPCSSGGSTITLANQLMPTLKYWSTVDAVKIYDEAGTTAEPGGRSDSIPACLEP